MNGKNEHIELVQKWLADAESVTLEELEANAEAADAEYDADASRLARERWAIWEKADDAREAAAAAAYAAAATAAAGGQFVSYRIAQQRAEDLTAVEYWVGAYRRNMNLTLK